MTLRFHAVVWPESKLVDSYQKFLDMKAKGTDLQPYMSQNNHPNRAGHLVVAAELEKAFASDQVEILAAYACTPSASPWVETTGGHE